MTATRLLTSLVCLFAACSLRAFEVPTHVPADTLLVGRVKLAEVRGTTLAKALLDRHAGKIAELSTFFIEYVGVDLYSLETVWLLAPRKDHGVAIFQGTFDRDRINSRFGYLPNVIVIQRPGCLFAAQFTDDKEPGVTKQAALLDATTLVIGVQAEVESYLTAIDDPTRLLPADHPAVREVATSTQHLAATLFGNLAGWGDFDRNLATVATGVHVVAAMNEDVTGSVTVRTRQPEQAIAIGHLITGLTQLKAMDPQVDAKPLLRGALKSAQVETVGNNAILRVTLNGRDIQDHLAATP